MNRVSVIPMLTVQTPLVATTVHAILDSLEMEPTAGILMNVSVDRVMPMQLVLIPTEAILVNVTVGLKEMEPFAHVS